METLTGILLIIVSLLLINKTNYDSSFLDALGFFTGIWCFISGMFLFANGILPVIKLLN